MKQSKWLGTSFLGRAEGGVGRRRPAEELWGSGAGWSGTGTAQLSNFGVLWAVWAGLEIGVTLWTAQRTSGWVALAPVNALIQEDFSVLLLGSQGCPCSPQREVKEVPFSGVKLEAHSLSQGHETQKR